MRKVILYTAASLDNYIARPNGDIDWLQPDDKMQGDEDYGYSEFIETIDTTLMGNNTYNVIMGFNQPFPYPELKNYVFSRSVEKQETGYVKFISGNIAKFVQNLKEDKGKDIWLIGGGQVNRLMLRNNLIDKIILTIIPVVLGEGIPLFDRPSGEAKFDLENCKSYNTGLVQLTMRTKKR